MNLASTVPVAHPSRLEAACNMLLLLPRQKAALL
jgi:hypothetical protein